MMNDAAGVARGRARRSGASHRCGLRALPAGLLACTLLAGGCIRREISRVDVTPDVMESTDHMRAATNLPQQLTVVTPPATRGDCPPVLSDPGLHATLRLHRSVLRPVPDSANAGYRAMGDYSVVPHGLYGEEQDEGVRVDCSRLRPIGVVRLRGGVRGPVGNGEG